jgi:DNA-binding CsgD family transcriptional regulator
VARGLEMRSRMPDRALVQVLLEAIPSAALLLGGDGRVLARNTRATQRHAGLVMVPYSDVVVGDRWQVHHVVGSGLLVVVEREGKALEWLSVLQSRWQLTAREAEVLGILAEGASNESISLRIGCSVRTVEGHVSRVLEKSRLGSRASLVAAAWAASLELQALQQWGCDHQPAQFPQG